MTEVRAWAVRIDIIYLSEREATDAIEALTERIRLRQFDPPKGFRQIEMAISTGTFDAEEAPDDGATIVQMVDDRRN